MLGAGGASGAAESPGRDIVNLPRAHRAVSVSLRDVATVHKRLRHAGAIPPNRAAQGPTGAKAQGRAAPGTVQRAPAPNRVAATAGLSFDGLDSSLTGAGGVPDTNGDVGPNHYVQNVNGLWEIFDKSGHALAGPYPENALWSTQPSADRCRSKSRGDPVVLYDQLADRWLFSYFAFDVDADFNPVAPFIQCVAVSQTGNPAGTWWVYEFDLTTVSGGGFPDYPKFGVWPDGYYMSANLFPTAGGVDGMGVVFERDAMLTGGSARGRAFTETGLNGGMLPADFDGAAASAPAAGTPNPFVAPDPSAFKIRVEQFSANWGGAAATRTERLVDVGTYDPTVCADRVTLQCIPQPGTAVKLDPLDGDQYMFRAAYRKFGDHESLVVNESVDAGGRSGIHWYELRGITGATPTDFQEGTFSPDSTGRWLGSAAMDKAGNIGVGYNVSSSSVFPGLRYAGRTAGAPAGTFDVSEGTLVAGGGSKTVSNSDGRARWGDYSALTVDPADDCTFWLTGEYLPDDVGAFDWHTRIGTFRIPGCASNQPPSASFTASPNPVVAGGTVTFDGSASSDPEDGDVASYAWDLDGNGSFETATGTTATTQKTFPTAGTFTVSLRVTDSQSATNVTSRTVTVNPVGGGTPPGNDDRADATLLAAGVPSASVSTAFATSEPDEVLSCSQFIDPSPYGKTAWYRFHTDVPGTFTVTTSAGFDTVMSVYGGDGTTPLACNDDGNPAAAGPSRISGRATAGNFLIQVGGYDGGAGPASGTLTVDVEFTPNSAPSAAFTIAPNPATTGQPVAFDAGGSADADGAISGYEWDLDGNGSYETDTGTTPTTGLTYPAPGDVTVRLRVTDDDGATTTTSHVLTVSVPPVPPAPSASIGDVTVAEGNAGTKTASLVVSLSSAPAGAVSVDFATANGSAIAPGDYAALSGTLMFGPGEREKAIAITVVGDRIFEPTESFAVHLANPSGVAIARAAGVATIQNDDASPRPVRATGDASLSYGSVHGGINVGQLTVTAPRGERVRVRCPGCRPFARTARKIVVPTLSHRRLRNGSSIRIFITKRGAYGKLIRYRVARNGASRSADRCLAPGTTRAVRCP
jgi:hypothetical protein